MDFDPDHVRPLLNRVLIEEDAKPEMSAGGIHLPSTARDAQYSTPATVLAVGPGRRLKNGTVVAMDLKKGDRIVLGKAHGTLLKGQRIRVVDYDVIEGTYEEGSFDEPAPAEVMP
jgi:chaperonin GroES